MIYCDVSESALRELCNSSTLRRYKRLSQEPAAMPGGLTPLQAHVLKRLDGARLEGMALHEERRIQELCPDEQRALVALLKGRLLWLVFVMRGNKSSYMLRRPC